MIADWPILTLTIWLPIIGGFMVLASGDREANATKWTALTIAILTFIVSLPLWFAFDSATAEMQFVERVPWVPAFNVEYYMGIDGISMPLIILTTFITPLVVIAGWEVIKYRPSQYMAAFIIMEG
ncbi:MAG: NADH-quinone oxidoreductase subunit M, partial [Candidatus Thiodiazotropha sp. (ex Monitilora ramsayi)]|nr:NADH-quinone oxidoreductase subunit M [Candidatus Thiodiazotropha sp. (ex Monitilora ramsayi)]